MLGNLPGHGKGHANWYTGSSEGIGAHEGHKTTTTGVKVRWIVPLILAKNG